MKSFKDGILTFGLDGRLDTTEARDVDRTLMNTLQACGMDVRKVIIDCLDLKYISSTGLRIILKYKKRLKNLELVNVCDEVFRVFEMTGIARMMTIRKALRKVELRDDMLLSSGANGSIYRINDDEIVKVCTRPDKETNLIDEFEQAREAFVMGVPTFICFDIVDCGNGRKGVAFEAINSETLAKRLIAHPEELDVRARDYAEILKITNSIEASEGQFRSINERLIACLYCKQRSINDQEAKALEELVRAIPERLNIIHNDGHTNNILIHGIEEQGMVLIDMGEMGVGHPIHEILGCSFIMLSPKEQPASRFATRDSGLEEDMRWRFMRKVFSHWFSITDEAELNRVMQAASSVGTIKSACLLQEYVLDGIDHDCVHDFIVNYMLPRRQQILEDIRYLCNLIDGKR